MRTTMVLLRPQDLRDEDNKQDRQQSAVRALRDGESRGGRNQVPTCR